MTVRDFVTYIANSQEVETELCDYEPQEVLIQIGKKYHNVESIWVRGDNKLIIETGEERA